MLRIIEADSVRKRGSNEAEYSVAISVPGLSSTESVGQARSALATLLPTKMRLDTGSFIFPGDNRASW